MMKENDVYYLNVKFQNYLGTEVKHIFFFFLNKNVYNLLKNRVNVQ